MKTTTWMALVCALLAGCGGSTDADTLETNDNDSGTRTDTSASTKDDSALTVDTAEPATDSNVATDDTGTAPKDSGSTGTDTGGSTGGGEAGKINCGPTLKCTLPQVCCIGFGGGASYSCAASCSGLTAKAACDGPEDCSGGARCCSGFPSGAQCKAMCGSGDQDMCHVDSDCTGGKTCKECSTPGGGPAMKFCVVGGKCPY